MILVTVDMWELRNRSPFAGERTFARLADGSEVLVVAARATFTVGDDCRLSVADEQEPVRLVPEFFGDERVSALRYDGDMIVETNGTDIVVHGSAWVPGGREATTVDAQLTVDGWERRIRIVGDRRWRPGLRGLVPDEPRPFCTMPVTWERAWGGTSADGTQRDERNPIGCGAFAAVGGPVPNVEAPDRPIRTASERHGPVGIGPIPVQWDPRRADTGTHDERWLAERFPLPPTDRRIGATRCAPPPQRLDRFLRGGESVSLRNFTPEGALDVTIPYLDLGCTSHFTDGSRQEHRGRMTTLYLEPDRRRLIVVWVSVLACHHKMYRLRHVDLIRRDRVPLGTMPPRRLAARRS